MRTFVAEFLATMLLLAGGWNPRSIWQDAQGRFMVILADAMGGDLSA